MSVGLVGTGPAAAAVEAALGDVERAVDSLSPADIGPEHDLVVAVDTAGATAFERVADRAGAAGVPYFAVELGGIGGYPVVDAAVAALSPAGPCYRCLATRVASNVPADADPVSPPSDATARFAGAIAGHSAVDTLDPGEPDPTGRVIELPRVDRALLPVPGCECGDDRDRTLDRAEGMREVDAALAAAERGLDDRLGVVAEVGEAESYPAPYYLAQVCDTAGFSEASAARQAAGVDPGWNAAFMKALGEGFERYCAGVYRQSEFATAAAADVEDAVAPSSFAGPDDWPEAVDADERPWVPGRSLATREGVRLPAELVHYPPPERTIRPAVTTGLGLGNSTVEALLSGLYEVVERDAATIAWYSTYDPLELVVDDDAYRELAARAGAEGLEATALLLTQDVDVPVVGVAVTREEYPKLALGTAADLDPARAARNALAEAVQNWVELREMGPDGAAETDGAIGEYAADPSPVEPFVDPGGRVPADSVGADTVPDGRDRLAAVRKRVTDAGLHPYAARTTTRDVRAMGFEAVRVLVPAAQPLFFDTPYFGERARSVPGTLGFEPAVDRRLHPYP
ncbi:bacteriocin biosynthesis protein SagD [Halobacteriales archaeon QH_8_68_33]|nr:MAG: bacteriocin biosynthesis protein SagD [Halobacteriales archaeon QH_8_68_33]